ncbi:MAG: phosphatidate cytidylyltransferase [Dehalococcoidia bacterium]|nr:phosphatidate cytidylyltransferase [Dehalococcoidia bacterium]
MLKQRIVCAVVGVPLLVLVTWFGHLWFGLFVAAVVLAGTLEFYQVTISPSVLTQGNLINRSLIYFGLLWSMLVAMAPLIFHCTVVNFLPAIMTFAVLISLIWVLFQNPREGAFPKWAWLVAGVVYVGWMLSYWMNLRIMDGGRDWVYLALFTAFANDTGAFFIGRKWGRHRLAPSISPGKTWEGASGGLLSAVLTAVVVAMILNSISVLPVEYWQVILIGCLISVFAQLGDLVESMLKRNAGVKDTGKFLPGHGGILDRFDSLIFVGPVVYYYVLWIV